MKIKYPFSILVLGLLLYLSFFDPSQHQLPEVTLSDKIIHAVMYFGVTMIFWFEWMWNHRQERHLCLSSLLLCFAFPVILGGLIELGQEYFTEVRNGDIWDFVANCVGAMLATLLSLLVVSPIFRKFIHK